jgi:sugar phosphate isomerase/epimerase
MCLRAEAPSRFVKGVTSAVFPLGTPFADCVARASAAGFEATEIRIDPKEFLYTQSTREDAQKLG